MLVCISGIQTRVILIIVFAISLISDSIFSRLICVFLETLYSNSWSTVSEQITRCTQKDVKKKGFKQSHYRGTSSDFSSVPGLWPGAELYISLHHTLTDWVGEWVSRWVRKLKISVNIDARTLKFGMEHPWAHWLRFRKIQFEEPCFVHKRAMFWPFLGQGATG